MSEAAAAAPSAAGSAASGAGWLFGRIWACFAGAFSIFSSQVKKLPVGVVTIMLRIINLCNAVLLGCACFFAFTMTLSLGSPQVTRFFLSTYIGLFAVLLVLFETRVKWTSKMIRRMFGFMFTFTGRTIFLIFLGAICFGMLGTDAENTSGYTWCLWVGIATSCNAMFNCFIICSHPGFQKANSNPDAETAGEAAGGDPSKLSEAQVRAYLEAHPHLTVAAASAVTTTAAQPASGAVSDWGAASDAAPPKKAGGFFNFGRGGNKSQAPSAPAATPKFDVESSGGAGYTPPAVQAAPPAAYVAPVLAVAVAATPSATAPAATADSDNPFEVTNNPFGKQ